MNRQWQSKKMSNKIPDIQMLQLLMIYLLYCMLNMAVLLLSSQKHWLIECKTQLKIISLRLHLEMRLFYRWTDPLSLVFLIFRIITQ